MEAIFFTMEDGHSVNSFDDIAESSILGGGHFSKDQISELLDCFRSSSSVQSDNLWLLSSNFSESLSGLNADGLKDIAVNWSIENSWESTNVNSIDLAGHLLELKYAYSTSNTRICVWFE
jgi:hypothetical protein